MKEAKVQYGLWSREVAALFQQNPNKDFINELYLRLYKNVSFNKKLHIYKKYDFLKANESNLAEFQ